jgi:hypothetical protein
MNPLFLSVVKSVSCRIFWLESVIGFENLERINREEEMHLWMQMASLTESSLGEEGSHECQT